MKKNPETLERYRTSVAAQKNRAVFEIPDILARILEMGRTLQAAEGLSGDEARAANARA